MGCAALVVVSNRERRVQHFERSRRCGSMVYIRKVLRFRGILLGERMEKTDEIRRISVKSMLYTYMAWDAQTHMFWIVSLLL